jgi:hypothetical protein
VTAVPDLDTRRALLILHELNIEPEDQETLRRVRGFIRVNGYTGVRHAAEITKNISLKLSRAGKPPIKDRWAYCRQVYNQAAGYASWIFKLLNLVEVSLRAWIDGALAAREGEDWHKCLHLYFRSVTIERIEAQLAERGTSLTTLASGAEMLDLIDLGALRALIRDGYGAAPRRAGLLLPSLPSDGTTGAHMEPKALDATLKRMNDARNDVMHHRLMTTPTFSKLLEELRGLLERRDFDVDRTLERVEVGRLQALDLGPDWLSEPAWRATIDHAPVRAAAAAAKKIRRLVPAIAGGSILVRGVAATQGPHPRVVVVVDAKSASDGDPLQRCPQEDSDAMRQLLATVGALEIRFVRRGSLMALVNAVCAPLRAIGVRRTEDGQVAITYAAADRAAALRHVGIDLLAQLCRAPIRLTFEQPAQETVAEEARPEHPSQTP